jgi:hypothetical protein
MNPVSPLGQLLGQRYRGRLRLTALTLVLLTVDANRIRRIRRLTRNHSWS